MRRALGVAALAACLLWMGMAPAAAQTRPGSGGFGRGYSMFGVLVPDLADLNAELKKSGLAPLDGAVFMGGGGGYGGLNNWVFGGFGGGAEMSAASSGGKSTEMSIGFGLWEVARLWRAGKYTFHAGAMLGLGGATLIVSEGGPKDVQEALTPGFDTVLDAGFGLAGPTAGIEVDLTPYFSLGLKAGYLTAFGDAWRHRSSGEKLSGLAGGFKGPFVSVSIGAGGPRR